MVTGDISGVLFDVGGVLVGLDGVPSLAKLLQIEPLHDEIHRRWVACPSVVRHETGQISADQFAVEVVQDLGLSLPPEAFLAEFAGWLTAPLPGAFELLARIPSAYASASTLGPVVTKVLFDAAGLSASQRRRAASYRASFPLQEALFAVAAGDFDDIPRPLDPYDVS